MLIKKVPLLDGTDFYWETIAVLLANAGQQDRTLSTAAIGDVLGFSRSSLWDSLHKLRRLGLVTKEGERPVRWKATANLMGHWRDSGCPGLRPRAAVAGGFDVCPFCQNPNTTLVRFCTFCGLEVQSGRASATAAAKLELVELHARNEETAM